MSSNDCSVPASPFCLQLCDRRPSASPKINGFISFFSILSTLNEVLWIRDILVRIRMRIRIVTRLTEAQKQTDCVNPDSNLGH
jgi:hypothetical protein